MDKLIRQQALDPTQSFIVQAPAGSGKTELLTQRYLVLLAHAKKAPEEIIAITFTRKAASEMRNRIMHALLFAKTQEPPQHDYRYMTWRLANNVLKKDHQHHWELTKNPNRLRIMTIDSLSAFLCRQAPILTEWGAQPDIIENAIPYYQQAVKKLLLTIITEKKWRFALDHLLLHLDNQIEKLENLLIELLSHRDQWLTHILFDSDHANSIRSMLENNLKHTVLEKIQLAQSTIPDHLKKTLLLLACHAGHYLKIHNADNPIAACADLTFRDHATLLHFPSWLGLAKLLLTQGGEFRKTLTVQQGFHARDENKPLMLILLSQLLNHDAFKEALRDIVICPPINYTEQQWETLRALTTLLPLLCAQLSLIFREQGKIDFIELNMAALKALGQDESPTDLTLYLDYQIRHLLVDEFQDTSVMHLQLLQKIVSGWEKQDGRTLFLVGDPMQSIYRFRNAEVGLFLQTQRYGLGPVSLVPLTLSMNFRSEKNIVDWFNQSFQNIFPKSSDIATGRITYTHSTAAKKTEILKETSNTVAFFPILSDNENEEADIMTDHIQNCLWKNPNDTIAILVRTRSQVSPIITALQKKQILFQAIDIQTLSDHSAIQDCLALTRALMHRADRMAWLSVLRAPFCGCTLADLLAIAQYAFRCTIYEAILNAEKIEVLSSDGLQRVKRIRSVLQDACEKREWLSWSRWIETIWIQIGGPATLNTLTEIQYVQAYFNLLDNMTKHADVIHPEYITEQVKQLFATTAAADNPRLQIMTIHKAKGLEFDHVLIPGLHRATTSDSEKLFRWLEQPGASREISLILAPIKSADAGVDTIYQYLKQVENKKLDHEITRLLYVAITRAKKSCYLYANHPSNDEKNKLVSLPKNGSFLEKLWPVLKPIIENAKQTKKQFETSETIQRRSLTRLVSDWQLPVLSTIKKNTEEKKSKTAQLAKIDIQIEIEKHKIVGTFIHEILNNITQTDVTKWKCMRHFPLAQWRSRLFSLGLLPSQIDESLVIAQTAIQNMLSDERGLWILSAHQQAQSEWQLTWKSDEKITQFVIDRSFVDEHNVRWIIDYKISEPNQQESHIDFLHHQKKLYGAQLHQYAKIIMNEEKRDIQLGLYFPLWKGWIAWAFDKYDAALLESYYAFSR